MSFLLTNEHPIVLLGLAPTRTASLNASSWHRIQLSPPEKLGKAFLVRLIYEMGHYNLLFLVVGGPGMAACAVYRGMIVAQP